MNINEVYTQFMEFWNKIFLIILFHIIFVFVYKFVFGEFPIKIKLENYIESNQFNRTKKILKDFELWSKLPFIILFLFLFYLTFFNCLTNGIYSMKIFPINMRCQYYAFINDYKPVDDIKFIAKYSKDSTINLSKTDNLKNNLLEEYKIKNPEQYSIWIKWLDKQTFNRKKHLVLLIILQIILLIFLCRKLIKTKIKRKAIIFRYLFILIISFPLLFYFRYRTEQSIEQKYSNEVFFIKNSLASDNTKTVSLSKSAIAYLNKNIDIELSLKLGSYSFWVSKMVENNKMLSRIFGTRKLMDSKIGQMNLYDE
jgi:hypothetical protein